jgi:hypothetical protein
VPAITQTDPDDCARISAIDFTHRLVRNWQEALEADLLGAYLIGSLAHSGFSRRYSDVDVALVTTTGLSPQVLDDLRSNAVVLSADWGPKLSIFWADQHFSLGRFPPLDRIDYLDHAVVLMERKSVRPARPTLDEIRLYLRGTPFANWADLARSFAVAKTLEPKDHKAYLRTLLYPARFCYSWITGLVSSNDVAVTFLRERHVNGLDVSLIDRALHCRQVAADPDALFPARTVLPAQIDACAALRAGGDRPPR